jgi:stage II sporulation protein D
MVGSIVTGVTQQLRRPLRSFASALVVVAVALVGTALVPAGALAPAAAKSARHEVYPVPPSGVYTIHGRGAGHGHGMSQWGAYGAAKVAHLSMNQILHFYYPHTTLATRSTTRTIRILLTSADASGRGYLQVRAAAGLAMKPTVGKRAVMPTKTAAKQPISAWRLQPSGKSVVLSERSAGKWTKVQTVGSGGATFSDTASEVAVVTPGGIIKYRGSVTGEIEAGEMEAVNVVNLELYLRSVVPSEMPSSWSAAALQAQAVASRTYARHGINHPKASWFDADGDTRDQAYGGVGAERASTTAAIKATAGEVIVDSSGHAVFAQYASADGGWTVSGGEPYLPAKADPYDGEMPNDAHAWTRDVSATTLEADHPSLGTLKDIEITGRNGDGTWGGRVTTLTLVGSKASVRLSGTDLQLEFGWPSPWFRPTPLPAAPSKLTVSASGQTVTATWKAPVSVSGASAVTGYRFTLTPGAHTQTVAANVLTASVAKLAAGTYTVTVVALSKAGKSPPATATVKVAAS